MLDCTHHLFLIAEFYEYKTNKKKKKPRSKQSVYKCLIAIIVVILL